MKKYALVTLACGGHRELHDLTGPMFANYARKWNMDYLPILELLDQSRPASWSKLVGIRPLLESYSHVIYIDADALILRSDRFIVQVVPTNFEFAWAKTGFKQKYIPNAGVMLFRKSEPTFKLLDLAYQQTDLIYDAWWEQAALLRILGYEDPREPKEVKQKLNRQVEIHEEFLPEKWNMTVNSQDIVSPHIRHFAGSPLTIKKILILELIFRNFTFAELRKLGYDLDWLRFEQQRVMSVIHGQINSKPIIRDILGRGFNRITGGKPKYK